MAKATKNMEPEIFIKELSRKERRTDMDSISGRTVLITKELLSMELDREVEYGSRQKETLTKESTKTEKSKVMVFIHGQMV